MIESQLEEKGWLTRSEKAEVFAKAESLVGRDEILSLCAYGSRVAGYAEKDSDYDIIVVTKGAKKPASLPREKDKSPPIIVHGPALLRDAMRPTEGDYFVGRLLNVYEPVINKEFLQTVEGEYKKRVMAEQLVELQTDYGDFSSNLILPYEYFLFDRLHKRAEIYPEVTYGYTRTYTCHQSGKNLEFALGGFREAAKSLASKGIIDDQDDSVRIFRGKKRTDALSELLRMYPLSTTEALRFAAHAVANRAGFEFKTRPVSKLRGAGKAHHPPLAELDHPKKLLRLYEGVIFDDSAKMIEDLAETSKFGDRYEFEEKKMGDLINSTKRLEIWDEKRREKFVLKHFPELKAAKWAILNMWSLAAKRFNKSPLSRLNREVAGVRRLRELGMKTHRILGIVLDERTLVTEYVEGFPLSDSVRKIIGGESTDTRSIEDYARVLARLHRANMVYGDTKPQNVLVSKAGIELLDLEQAVEDGDKAWDLAEFLYFSATHLEEDKDDKNAREAKDARKREAGTRLVAESFLDAYRSENGIETIARARSLRYLLPFVPVLVPKMMKVVRRELDRFSSATVAGA